MNHAECFFMNHPDENIIDLLKSLFEKYDSEKHQQHLWLHIGMVYSEEYCDLENALVSFEKGIRINPSSGIVLVILFFVQIHNFCNFFTFHFVSCICFVICVLCMFSLFTFFVVVYVPELPLFVEKKDTFTQEHLQVLGQATFITSKRSL